MRRRTVLAAGAGAAAGLSLPAIAHAGGRRVEVRFVLGAVTLDGGEQVTSLTLGTSRLGPIDPARLGAFRVHAKATSPIPLAAGDQIFSEYDVDRAVTATRLDRHGNIVLELAHGEGQVGGGTLGYIVSRGRNVRLRLEYTITQTEPIRLRSGRRVTVDRFEQGRLVNPEVDAFGHRVSRSGMKYRLFEAGRPGRPLVVWLHGGGEGASLPDNYYDNETTLRANRGALGFATREAQRIFGGASVVAPQSTSFWLEDGDRFAPQIHEIVREVARRQAVDRDRIYLAGCSNGGYMSMKMTAVHRDLFAAAIPICGVVTSLTGAGDPVLPDAELARITTPTWLVTSRDDDTVAPEPNTIHAAEVIPRAKLTLYDNVTWDGYRFPGHWSWIYVARNDRGYWQWMARQRR